jgi:hypothetical protein
MSINEFLSELREKINGPNGRLIVALACYFVLIVVALVVLLPVGTSHERFVLGFVLALFAILIIKTIAYSKIDSK